MEAVPPEGLPRPTAPVALQRGSPPPCQGELEEAENAAGWAPGNQKKLGES